MLRAVAVSYVGFGAGLVSSIVVARVLGVEGKGIFSLFMATVAGVSLLATLGIGHGQMFHAARDSQRLASFLPNARAVSLVLGGVVAIVYFVAGAWRDLRIVELIGAAGTAAGIIAVPVLAMLTFQRQYLLIRGSYVLAKANSALLLCLPLVALAAVVPFGLGSVEVLIGAVVTGQVLSLIGFEILLARDAPSSGSFSWPFAKASVGFGIRQYASDLALFLTNRVDFFLVAAFLGPEGLGIYSVAVALAEVASRLPSELGTMLFPAFASGEVPEGSAPALVRRTLAAAIATAAALAVASGPLVTLLYGDAFASAVPAFRWLLLGTVAWSTIYVTWNRASSAGRPGLGVFVFGGAAILDVVLNLILLPRLGVSGAAIAATASYGLAAALFLGWFCRHERCSLADVLLVRPADYGWIANRALDAARSIRPNALLGRHG